MSDRRDQPEAGAELVRLLTVEPAGSSLAGPRARGTTPLAEPGGEVFTATGYGPADKRAFGGQFVAQALRAAAATVTPGARPTSVHVQFLRAGTAGPVDYRVERTYDGRTAMTRRVCSRQDGRLNTVATVSFATELPGPVHPRATDPIPDPMQLPVTAPPGPAPGVPLHAFDLRYREHGERESFVREFHWRTAQPLPGDPILHYAVAAYLTDLYLLDTALRVHNHTVTDRHFRYGTTDSAIWFHTPVRADEWNLLRSCSPAASAGRGLVTATLFGADGRPAATLVQEGLVAARE
ncbi:MAG: thioesterase family protein [Mycobacterium sp.]|nr:thioesterase family protein [Mycobacterium sp.]